MDSGTLPPAAYGVRMIAAGIGGGGGKEQLPKLAGLARELGFHVRVVIDNDKPGSDTALLAELNGLAEQVIRLPERTAVERALVRGLPADAQRTALSAVNDLYGLGLDVDDITDRTWRRPSSSSSSRRTACTSRSSPRSRTGLFRRWPPRSWTPSPGRPGSRYSRNCRTHDLPADPRPAAGHRRRRPGAAGARRCRNRQDEHRRGRRPRLPGTPHRGDAGAPGTGGRCSCRSPARRSPRSSTAPPTSWAPTRTGWRSPRTTRSRGA